MRLGEREALLTGGFLCWTDADRFTDCLPSADGDERSFAQELARTGRNHRTHGKGLGARPYPGKAALPPAGNA